MKIHRLGFYLLLSSLVLSACQFVAPTKVNLPPSSLDVPTQSIVDQALKDKIKNKPVYTGPIRIGLLPKLASSELKALPKDITQILEQGDFQLQSLPDGPLVFQESFYQTGETQRTIKITQTEDRYTLHVQKQTGNPQVEININGNTWIKEKDFKRQREVEKSSLLLNPNNVMRVRIKGKAGDVVTVSLVKGGSAGTILRRSGRLRQPGETQATHLANNDTNIFDPHDSLSLSDFEAYHQDLIISTPDNQNPVRISGMQANGGPAVRFETGSLVLAFADPEAGENVLETYYGATLTDELDGFYKFKLDLSQSPVADIMNLIQYLNSHAEQTLTELDFSSYEALQTFALSLDILKRFPGLISSLEFNEMGTPAATFNDSIFLHDPQSPLERPNVEVDSLPFFHDIKDCNGKSAESWWLNETKTFQAWDYSIGTGVKVAWLDRGYNLPFADIDARRLEDGHGSLNKFGDIQAAETNSSSSVKEKYHALFAMLTGFAERDNGIKTSGIAPNTTVWPYALWASWDFAKSIKEAREDGVDVIGINYGWQKSNLSQDFWYNTNEALSYIFVTDSVEVQIKKALAANIPVVMAAHNFAEPLGNWKVVEKYSPNGINDSESINGAGHGDIGFDHLIVVGDAGPLSSKKVSKVTCPAPPVTPAPPLGMYSRFRDDLAVGKNGAGSNYGNGLVWAPGQQIFVSSVNNPNKVASFDGTSAATPFVTAVVALMKSRNPSLTPQEIQDILLHQAKGTPVVPHPEMVSAGIEPTFLIDVEKAVKAAGNFKEAQEYFGYVYLSDIPGTGRKLHLNQYAVDSGAEKEKEIPFQTVSNDALENMNVGSFVRVKGWSDIQAGKTNISNNELEVSEVHNICQYPCGNSSLASWFTPKLNSIDFDPANPKSSQSFTMTFHGEHLLANLSQNSELDRFRILFQPLNTSGMPDGSPHVSLISDNNLGVKQDIIEIANDGTEVKIRIQPYDSSADIGVPPGDYEIALAGIGVTNYLRNSGSGFTVSSAGGSSGFVIKSVPPAPEYIPQDYIFNKVNGNWIIQGLRKQVDANEFAGLYFTQDIKDIKVKVGPIEVPIASIVKDLLVFGIPEDLPAGVHDVFIESTQGNLTLEAAIEKASPAIPAYLEAGPPPSANPGEYEGVSLFNIEGNDEARVYLNDNLIGTATSAEETYVPLGRDTPNPLRQDQRNKICFELENRGGGYTYGFEVDGGELYREVQGTPGVQNVVNPDGSEDVRQGVVIRQCLTMNRFRKPVGTPGQSFWARVFNLTPGSTLTFTDGAYEEHVITASSNQNETSFEMPLYSPGNEDVELK